MATTPAWFDEDYYLTSKLSQLQAAGYTQYTTILQVKQAILAAGMTVYQHFETYSLVEGTSPNQYFNTQEYLEAKAAQLNSVSYQGSTSWTAQTVAVALANAGFTSAYDHWAQYGWLEGINPSNSFDVSQYLQDKATQCGMTVAQVTTAFQNAGLNPISHYDAYGHSEGLTVTAVPASEQVAGYSYNLTTAIDVMTANVFNGSLTTYYTDGKGPTLNPGDTLTGEANRTDNTLNITDISDNNSGGDYMPVGVVLNNVQKVVLTTNNNTLSSGFDVSGYTSVNSLTATTAGRFGDVFIAGNGSGTSTATTVNVTHKGTMGLVIVEGGSNVTVTNAGGDVLVGDDAQGSVPLASMVATGAVVVNQRNTGTGGVAVLGGTTVNVTVSSTSNQGSIDIGNTTTNTGNSLSGGLANASGNITVNTAGTGTVTVMGGGTGTVSVSDTALKGAGAISVGDVNNVVGSDNNSGDITVTETASVAYNGLSGTGNNATPSGAITVAGGDDVTVTTNAANAISVGNTGATNQSAVNPTGTITVTNTGVETTAAAGDIEITGGTKINVTTTGSNVSIGRAANNKITDSKSNPSGDVIVTENMDGAGFARSISIDGGAAVTVNAMGQNVTIGADAASGPTGAVKVSQADMFTGNNAWVDHTSVGDIAVDGGTTVDIATTGGNVSVGGTVGGTYVVPSDTVSITRTFSGPGTDTTAVQGGKSVTINTTQTSGAITVGASPTLTVDGTALKNATLDPTANVSIKNVTTSGSATAYGTSTTNVYTNGATKVDITGGNVGTIEDVESTLATGGSGTGKAVGTSTLSTVSITGQTGSDGIAINSDALIELDISGSRNALDDIVTLTNHTAGHALKIVQSANNGFTLNGSSVVASTTVNDATATDVTVSDDGTASEALLTLQASKMTTLTLANAGLANVDVASDSKLTTITLTGAGTTDLAGVDKLTTITTIDASKSSGAVITDLAVTTDDGVVQTFTGGSGQDLLTVHSNIASWGDSVSLVGGSGQNDIIVADYAGVNDALGNTTQVRGFEYLGLAEASTGAYDATGFSGVIEQVALAGDVTINNAAKNASLTIEASPGHDTKWHGTTVATQGTNDALTVNLNVGSSKIAVAAGTVTANGYETLNLVSNGSATNTITLSDITSTGKGALNISGTGKLTVTDNTAGAVTGFNTITVTDSSTVDVTKVSVSNLGATITGGTGYLKASGADGSTVTELVTIGSVAAGETITVVVNGHSQTYNNGTGNTVDGSVAAAYIVANLAGTGANLTASGGHIVIEDNAAITLAAYASGSATVTSGLVGGQAEQVLTVTHAAGGTGNITFTMDDGSSVAVAVTNGDNIATVATKIAAKFNDGSVQGVTSAVANAGVVTITGGTLTNGVFSTSSFTDTGATGVTVGAISAATINTKTANDSFTTGTGGGTYNVGIGGSWDTTLHNFSSGSETENLSASTAVVDKLVFDDGDVSTYNGSVGGVTGFVTGSLLKSDQLRFATHNKTVVANTTAGVWANVMSLGGADSMANVFGYTSQTLAGLSFSIVNGVISFRATGGTLSDFGETKLLRAAEIIVCSGNTGGADAVAMFSYNGKTYVVAADTADSLLNAGADTNTLIELNDVSSTTGFGTTGAQGTVVNDGSIVKTDSNVTATILGGTSTLDETGYSQDSVTAGEFGSVMTKILNLEPSASLTLDDSGSYLGSIYITQTGTVGQNSLTLATAAGTYNYLNVTGDGLLVFNPSGDTAITTLEDGGTTDTLATIEVTGSHSLEIDTISDTALTKVDASAMTGGTLNLGADTAIANAGVTFTLSTAGASTITATGAGDTFTQATGGAGVVTLTGSGASDTFNVDSTGGGTITANGANDSITVGGTGSYIITATGASDTINVASGNGATTVTVGTNATVNIGTANLANAGVETVNVWGAVTGGTSSSFAETTITFASGSTVSGNKIDLSNTLDAESLGATWATSQVNVATCTTLQEALDLAANYATLTGTQGTATSTHTLAHDTTVIDWFQYSGNTYVVGMVNDTTSAVSQTGLDANDLVVKISGLVDLTSATLTTGASAGVLTIGTNALV